MILIAGCSVLDVVNSLSSTDGSSTTTGISYGDNQRHKLDVYLPERPARDPAWIVFFYGGGWTKGQRADYAFVGRRLAALGYYVVIPDYRLYPQVTFPAFIEDGANAVDWVFKHRLTWSADDLPVVLMGHSAGAQIAALLAMDTLARENSGPKEIDAWIGLAGPYNFLPIKSAVLKQVFPESTRHESQAINFVNADNPPALILHGETDRRVLPANSLSLHQALTDNGVNAMLRIYPNTGHAAILRPFASFLFPSIPVLGDISSFIEGL